MDAAHRTASAAGHQPPFRAKDHVFLPARQAGRKRGTRPASTLPIVVEGGNLTRQTIFFFAEAQENLTRSPRRERHEVPWELRRMRQEGPIMRANMPYPPARKTNRRCVAEGLPPSSGQPPRSIFHAWPPERGRPCPPPLQTGKHGSHAEPRSHSARRRSYTT